MMATLAVLEMCLKTSRSLVWIDGPGCGLSESGSWVVFTVGVWGESATAGHGTPACTWPNDAAIALSSLGVRDRPLPRLIPGPAVDVLALDSVVFPLSLSLLFQPSFLPSSIHPSCHISTPYRISLLSAPQPSVYGSIVRVSNWPSVVLLVILHYARPRRERALQVANHLCRCCHWYSPRLVCLLQSSPWTIISTSTLI